MNLGDRVYIKELDQYGIVKGIVGKQATLVQISTESGSKIIDVIQYTVVVVNLIDKILPVLTHIVNTIKSWFK